MPAVAAAIASPNCFSFAVNNFQCNIALPDTWGLVDLLTQSANLYAATLEQYTFRQEFRSAKAEKIGAILDLVNNPESTDRYRYVDFQIKMLHEAFDNDWKYPALVSRFRDQLTWHTGGIRLLATGMVMPQQEQALTLLVTDFDQDTASQFKITRPIKNDQDLCALLGVDFFQYRQHQPSTAGTRLGVWLEWQNTPGPCLHYIKPQDQSLDWSSQGELAYVPNLLPVARKLLQRPQIHYWSGCPDQLIDSTGSFGLKWMGDIASDFHGSDWTGALYRHFQYGINPGGVEFWIGPDRVLDAGELLFWLDKNYTVYLDREQRFAAMIDHSRWSKKIICMSK